MRTFIISAMLLTTFNVYANSNGSFICVSGGSLYSSNFSTTISAFDSDSDCRIAVEKSKNGFICTSNGALYSANVQTTLSAFASQADCQVAVDRSK